MHLYGLLVITFLDFLSGDGGHLESRGLDGPNFKKIAISLELLYAMKRRKAIPPHLITHSPMALPTMGSGVGPGGNLYLFCRLRLTRPRQIIPAIKQTLVARTLHSAGRSSTHILSSERRVMIWRLIAMLTG